MRDVNRIESFLERVGKIWAEKCPDWRFGQLMYNLMAQMGDPFYWEEDTFIEKMKEYFGIEGDEEDEIDLLEPKMMTIESEEGTEQVEVILRFEHQETGKEYVVYTKNEIDENGNITVYSSGVNRTENSIQLTGIDDDEWEMVQGLLNELKKESVF